MSNRCFINYKNLKNKQKDETLVSSMGCNFGQGYYYSKPIPVKNYEEEFL